jgi:hypothetical protein
MIIGRKTQIHEYPYGILPGEIKILGGGSGYGMSFIVFDECQFYLPKKENTKRKPKPYYRQNERY